MPIEIVSQFATLATPAVEVIQTGITGDIGRGLTAALGCTAAALGVALIGTKAVEAVGRNPGASGKILVQSIIGMALAEAVAFYALFLYQG